MLGSRGRGWGHHGCFGRGAWLLAAGAIVLLAPMVAPRAAGAAEVTRVVTAFDDDNRFDFNLTLSFLHEAKSAFVKRESLVTRTAPNGDMVTRNELVKDLQFQQTRNILDLRADFGIFWDIGFHVDVPIVLTDDRRLDFDQSLGRDCLFPGQATIPTCVNAQNSTILRDGILPGFGQTSYGLDAGHNRPYQDPSQTVFGGPTRSGIEYLGLGVSGAIFNQARDDTKPTWLVGFDALLDVGKDMRFDPLAPGANSGVGLGYHQMVFSTSVSKRFRHFDPYFGVWYMLPVRSSGSPFQKYPGRRPDGGRSPAAGRRAVRLRADRLGKTSGGAAGHRRGARATRSNIFTAAATAKSGRRCRARPSAPPTRPSAATTPPCRAPTTASTSTARGRHPTPASARPRPTRASAARPA